EERGQAKVPTIEALAKGHSIMSDEDTVGSSKNSTAGSDGHSASHRDVKGSTSTGRSSDAQYEMEYDKMSQLMKQTVNAEKPAVIDWKPLTKWIRFDDSVDSKAHYAFAPMERRIAGSCHELLIAYLKSSDGQVVTRLVKLARDPSENNEYHFEVERKVAQYLAKIAHCVNHIFHSRNDVCIWPVETIYFEHDGVSKWATVQPTFLPSDHCLFVKIEPNSGRPCVNDPVVGRYQHCFAAITKGLNLIRDWQGYGVKHATFLQQCQFHCVPEARAQVRRRDNFDSAFVLVVIDPVLTTCHSHYETDNPTDFGVKALDEWIETHNCTRCQCSYFNLLPEIRFGFADPTQPFFDDKLSPIALKHIEQCRRELNIWCGDEDFAIPDVPSGSINFKLDESDKKTES
ncbi:hypothetical protein RFI_24359, partial [Reticulomyxa filosa]